MSDPIREVYDKYRNPDGSLRDYHYIVAGGIEDRQDFIDDTWLAIRAHVEAWEHGWIAVADKMPELGAPVWAQFKYADDTLGTTLAVLNDEKPYGLVWSNLQELSRDPEGYCDYEVLNEVVGWQPIVHVEAAEQPVAEQPQAAEPCVWTEKGHEWQKSHHWHTDCGYWVDTAPREGAQFCDFCGAPLCREVTNE